MENPVFTEVKRVHRVLFNVPNDSDNLVYCDGIPVAGVKPHYILIRFKLPSNNGSDGVYLNRHYYVERKDLGKSLVGKVVIIIKTMPDGRKFTLLDFIPGSKAGPLYEVKFSLDGKNYPGEKSFEIIGSESRVRFPKLTLK